MEFSPSIECSQHAVPSVDGTLIATVIQWQLILRSSTSLDPIRFITLDPAFAARVQFLRWSDSVIPHEATGDVDVFPAPGATDPPPRLLLADGDTVKVWDTSDPAWSATIDGAGGGVGKIANVFFGGTSNEVLVFAECGVKVTVWLLDAGRSIEIRDPKSVSAGHGYGYRPRTGHFALLTRPAAGDMVTIHAPGAYEVLHSFTVATVDAQGLKWSPCGRWIALWDSASSGYRVLIYTADGHLYRTFMGAQLDGSGGLGVKSVEWSRRGDYLAIGDHEKQVTLLNSSTFSPVMYLNHTNLIDQPQTSVWQEIISSTGQRSYARATQAMSPPSVNGATSDGGPKIGISAMAFNNPDGLSTLMATRVESIPTTVWIWSVSAQSILAVLIHHSPVKSMQWHPSLPHLLLLHCLNDEAAVYLWSSTWRDPHVVAIPLQDQRGRQEAKWTRNDPSAWYEQRPKLLFRNANQLVVGYVDDIEPDASEETRGLHQPTRARTNESDPPSHPLRETGSSSDWMFQSNAHDDELPSGAGEVDDTFHHRRPFHV
ncbi:MAG: hypothetical protein M1838_001212 [Thelocarpon superellum]|nr:MAG: hypothetical protein M1838_001212 [Thelocarpon superellum]